MKIPELAAPDAPQNPSSTPFQKEVATSKARHTRTLWALIFGSIALHGLLLWGISRMPTPPSPASEKSLEVELRDPIKQLPRAPKAIAVQPIERPKPPRRISQTPREKVRPTLSVRSLVQPRPRPRIVRAPPKIVVSKVVERKVVVPKIIVAKAPLVRTTKVVAKTGIIARKPTTTPPIAAPVAPRTRIAKAPDKILEQPRNPFPPAKTPTEKPLPAPNQGTGQGRGSGNGSGSGSGNGSGQGSGSGSGVGSGQGSGNGSGEGSGSGSGIGAGTGSGVGQGQGAGQGGGSGNGSGEGSGNGGGGGGGGNGGGGGGPFGTGGGLGEGPRHIVYVLDISTSMEPRIARAKQELRDALAGLQAGESFNIVAFYGKFRLFNQKLVDANPKSIAAGQRFLDSLRLSSGTNLERAFEKAFAARGVNVVIAITDGVPTYGLGSPDFSRDPDASLTPQFDKLARRVRQLNASGARIFTVALVGKNPDGTDDSFEAGELLQRIARESGGDFKTVRIDAPPQPDFPE